MEMLMLNERLATFTYFMSRLANKHWPYYIVWNDEYSRAFNKLKRYLATPPILSQLGLKEILYLYLAATKGTINSNLIRE